MYKRQILSCNVASSVLKLVFPHRSPTPPTVTCAMDAPASTHARLPATARPMSSWQWMPTFTPSKAARTSAVRARMASGMDPPRVSHSTSVSAPPRAAARVPVIVVTNGIASVQRSRFARTPMSRYFSGCVISGEVGFSKPDPRILFKALEMGGVAAERALMLGDEPTSDIAAARAAGVKSCWFNPTGRRNQAQHTPDFEVRALDEVLAWL